MTNDQHEWYWKGYNDAKKSLAQPAIASEHKPVAWMEKDVLPLTHIIKAVVRREKDETYTEPLYTTPPQRTWVHATPWRGLTDEEILRLWGRTYDRVSFARAIEAKLKEKNFATSEGFEEKVNDNTNRNQNSAY